MKLVDLLFGAQKAAPAADTVAGAVAGAVADPVADAEPIRAAAPHIDSPSILHALNRLTRQLELTLLDLRSDVGADATLRALALELIATVERNPDVAIAAVLLNQIAGAYGVRHCLEAGIVVVRLAQALGKPHDDVLALTAAALTMNVGMVRQSDLLHGREGVLSSEERAQVERHPHDSVALLRWAGVTDEAWLAYVLLHHENPDGSGYPDARVDDDMADSARLIALADRYCAMVSARNYRRSLLPPAALERLAREFDAALLTRFTGAIGAYPPGTLVRLSDGSAGVVSGAVHGVGTQTVCVLRDGDGGASVQPVHRLMRDDGCAVLHALHEDDARLRFTMQMVWGEAACL